MAAKPKRNPHDTVMSVLTKTQAAGATAGEEAMAVDKALKLIAKNELDPRDFAFPEGYDLDGKSIPTPPEPEPTPVVEAGAPAGKPRRIIKQACETYLLEMTGKTPDGFTTGHSYEQILSWVRDEFPGCNTSIKCLRWYATHMKEQGCRMPQKRDRPTPKPRQPKQQAAAA